MATLEYDARVRSFLSLAMVCGCVLEANPDFVEVGTDATGPSHDDSTTGGGPATSVTSTTDVLTGGEGSTQTQGTAGTESTSGEGVHLETYVATVAECISRETFDPEFCEQRAGGLGKMQTDAMDGNLGSDVTSFIRFDFDDELAGAEILEVRLQLTVTSDAAAAGPETGQVWRVPPFTRRDLYVFFPEPEMVLADSQGPVEPDDVFEWQIPVQEVQGAASLFVAVYPVATDGISWWNATGVAPPVLFVEAVK